MNEAEHLMKNYGDRGECYPSRPQAVIIIIIIIIIKFIYIALLILIMQITPSKISIIIHMIRKPNSVVLLLIQNNSQFKNMVKTCLPPSMLSSSSVVHVQGCSVPQIFSKQNMSPFEFSSCCSCHVFSYYFVQFLLLKRVTCPPFLFSQPKTIHC